VPRIFAIAVLVTLVSTVSAHAASDRARIASLRAIGGWVFSPAFVPSRFSLVTAETRPERDGPKSSYRNYVLTYCDRRQKCFSIASAGPNGGMGDAGVGDNIRPLKARSKYFGRFTIWARPDGSYLSDWLPDPATTAPTKSKTAERNHHFIGSGVTDAEVVKIVESLTPLR